MCKSKGWLTKRAVDGGDSARFTGSFLALSFFYISSRIYARPTTTNANRWAFVGEFQSG